MNPSTLTAVEPTLLQHNNSHAQTVGDLKATWLTQLKHLSDLVTDQILPDAFAGEVQAVRTAIEHFRLTVPLIGKFSVGKSTLLNRWLGHEYQPDSLEPCTSIATEFHYAAPGAEQFTVHRLINAQTGQTQAQSYPLADYAAFIKGLGVSGGNTSAQPPVFVEIHANRPQLAQHPDLILVDTPGLESTQGHHEQALARYVGEGVAFILCATPKSQIGQGELAFVERLRALGQTFSLLVCQEALSNLSERENNRRTMAETAGLAPEQLVRGCSATEGDLAGFEELLAHFETQKVQLFSRQFAPKVRALIERAERLLREQLALDTQANALHDKKTAIAQSMERLQTTFADEQTQLVRDCSGSILRQISSTIGSFLRERQRAYVEQLLGGQDCGPLMAADAQNAFQLATNQHLLPRLQEAGQRVGRTANLQGVSQLNLSPASVGTVEGQGGGAFAGVAAGAAAGAVLGSVFPIVGTVVGQILGGIVGYFLTNSKKDSEASSKVAQAIAATLSQIDSAVPGLLQQHCQSYLGDLRAAVEQQLATEAQHLTQLEAQLTADAERRQTLRDKAQAALDQVSKLLPPAV